MLSLESTSSRMGNLARQERYFGRVVSLDEIIESIENVTAGQVSALANEWFQQDRIAMTVLGSLNGFKFGRELLAC
jgi:predicted Zn-dependent peptidase